MSTQPATCSGSPLPPGPPCARALPTPWIKSAQIVEFLKALRAQLKRKLLTIWDGAAQHKSRVVCEYLDSTKGAIQMALLPGYSPDLNPVEYLRA